MGQIVLPVFRQLGRGSDLFHRSYALGVRYLLEAPPPYQMDTSVF